MFKRFNKDDSAKPASAAGPSLVAAPKNAPPADAKQTTPAMPTTATSDAAPVAKAPPKPKIDISTAPDAKEEKRAAKLLEIRLDLHKRLLESLNLAVLDKASDEDLRREIAIIAREGLREMDVVLNATDQAQLNLDLMDEVTGLGPIQCLLRDETVNDILINGSQQIFVERAGILELTSVKFKDEKHLMRIIDKIVSAVGRRVDESSPYVDARLSDGSRFNAMVPPCAVDGSLVSIRKFTKEKLSIEKLINFGAFTEAMATYLQAAVATRLNIIVSGGTGSGKTTTLNALSGFIGDEERIVTIEDTAELQLQQIHIGRMESRPPNVEGNGEVSQRDLLRNALRMRPDRIIVGETRGDEVIDMLQAMNTGHDGSMTTIHANSARDAVSRLENMIAMTGVELPLVASRAQISSAVDLIVQISRLPDGSRRMVSITEITGMEGEIISMQEIFKFQRTGLTDEGKILGKFVSGGLRSHFTERFRQWGYDLPSSIYTNDDG